LHLKRRRQGRWFVLGQTRAGDQNLTSRGADSSSEATAVKAVWLKDHRRARDRKPAPEWDEPPVYVYSAPRVVARIEKGTGFSLSKGNAPVGVV